MTNRRIGIEDAFFHHAREVLEIARTLPSKPYDQLVQRNRRLNKAVRVYLEKLDSEKNVVD